MNKKIFFTYGLRAIDGPFGDFNDPDGYNTNLASKERVESLEEKMSLLHNKIDSIYTLLETLSNRFNTLDYTGEVKYGDLYHASQSSKHISVSLTRKDELESANPYGDDDFATPK